VVQVSGGALARISSVNPSIKIKSNLRGKGSTQFLEQGFRPALFFEIFPQQLPFFGRVSADRLRFPGRFEMLSTRMQFEPRRT
jgi:hypothetical protein